jgi:hypothetical protein
MKKNLRNILTLALGFVTVIATAQNWDADSRTRVNMGGDNDQFTSDQRTSLGVSWGGNGWGINVSGTHNYALGTDGSTMSWNEAYATTDLMGYASVAVGRKALDYGSGSVISSNDWGDNPATVDGGLFSIANDMLGLDVGIYKNNGGGVDEEGTTNYLVNASKSDGDWSMNLLYLSSDNGTDKGTTMGLDLGYAMMGGDLDLDVSYNTASHDLLAEDMDMMSIGATYNVNDDMSVNATRTTYGDGGFYSSLGNSAAAQTGNSWNDNGNMGYLGANDEDMAFGVSYAMGDFSLGLSMHKITNTGDDMGDYERNVTEANLGYTMSDNANVGIKYATDNAGAEEDVKYMWLTLSITP